MSILSYQSVTDMLKRCLAQEKADDNLVVEGVINDYGFDESAIKENSFEIKAMLGELDDSFMQSGGGGMSFLNACMDKRGNHWAEHPTIEALFALGIGAGLGKWTLPKELWPDLHGGMPYFTVLDGEKQDA